MGTSVKTATQLSTASEGLELRNSPAIADRGSAKRPGSRAVAIMILVSG